MIVIMSEFFKRRKKIFRMIILVMISTKNFLKLFELFAGFFYIHNEDRFADYWRIFPGNT